MFPFWVLTAVTNAPGAKAAASRFEVLGGQLVLRGDQL
jgi:hypothetical protein